MLHLEHDLTPEARTLSATSAATESVEDFPQRLRRLRRGREMRQVDLAEAAGLSLSTITFYEMGRYEPSAGSVVKLAKALGCTTDELLGS